MNMYICAELIRSANVHAHHHDPIIIGHALSYEDFPFVFSENKWILNVEWFLLLLIPTLKNDVDIRALEISI